MSLIALAAVRATAQDPKQSPPFKLILTSHNRTLNGASLVACHEGAAIESLCIHGNVSSIFYLNYTQGWNPPSLGLYGSLTWNLPSGGQNFSSSMELHVNPTSNVALPLFFPGNSNNPVAIAEDGKLIIPSFVDDNVTPPKYQTVAPSRWWACITRYGYLYQTLNWVLGPGRPQNPSCEKVAVVRVYL